RRELRSGRSICPAYVDEECRLHGRRRADPRARDRCMHGRPQPREDRGYERMAERMVELAARQPGFLGIESVRDVDGRGITVSYWASEEAIAAWKAHLEHRAAQQEGSRRWCAHYSVRVGKEERGCGRTAPDSRRNELGIALRTPATPAGIGLMAE